MMKFSLYQIIKTEDQEGHILATLQLNNEHQIFTGHFPGQPVLPGACILNMVQEILSDTLKSRYRLKKASSLKFIAPINPRIVAELELKVNYKSVEEGVQLTASLSAKEVICFKMKGVYGLL